LRGALGLNHSHRNENSSVFLAVGSERRKNKGSDDKKKKKKEDKKEIEIETDPLLLI
jgi:hypothetical protein